VLAGLSTRLSLIYEELQSAGELPLSKEEESEDDG